MKLFPPIVILLFLYVYGASGLKDTFAGCENDSWHAFRDEKCLKVVVDQLLTHDDAQQFCIDQFGDSILIRINSLEEQEFLTKLVFDTYQVVDDVWLGAIRKTDSPTDFVWDDQSELSFTWWADGSPSGSFERNCTQLTSHLSRSQFSNSQDQNESLLVEDGQWTDAACSRRNLLVCQKSQNWNVADLQDAVLELRMQMAELKQTELPELRARVAELTETDAELRVQVAELKEIDAEHQAQLAELKDTVAKFMGNWPKNCNQVQRVGSNTIYEIYPFGPNGLTVSVQCDFETDGGVWTIIQQRSSGPKEQFFLDWSDYEEGFGDVDGNYWIGLKAMHSLTSEANQELRVELKDWEFNRAYANYNTFSVGNASDLYRLTVEGYSGDAGDSMTYHNGRPFSTWDKDNDDSDGESCAVEYHGAWWYNACAFSCLNGYYYPNSSAPRFEGLLWLTWIDYYSLKSAQMKIRERTV